MTIRTRFAPSPTGYLHIGGVRTALFNWLLARRHGGQFILRIDDTDSERNRPEALQPILDGFRWLGIDWDEGPEVGGPHGPYFQSQRNDRYVAATMQLLASGHAYPDYLTKEQLDAERKAAEAAKQAYVHRGPHRDTPPAECERLYRAKPVALRLKVPLGRTVVIEDLIRGRVEVQTDLIGDPVILRAPDADGTTRALYNFATVVDDADMAITHVIRSAEHLSNTPVQVLAYEALGKPVPIFAHVPMVNAPKSKEKLSKRKMDRFMTPDVIAKLRAVRALTGDLTDDAVKKLENLNPATVEFYRALGYLPTGVVNYLGRLGWSMDGESEYIPLDVMIANFSLERVNQSAASFDPDKLYWLAGEYMKQLPLADKVAGCLPFLRRAELIPEADPLATELMDRITRVIDASGDRIKLFSDAMALAKPFLEGELTYDAKAIEKRLKKPGALAVLQEFAGVLATCEPFDVPTLEKTLHDFCAAKEMKSGELVHPVRVAITGSEVGIGLFDALAILGRDEVQRRIERAVVLATA